MSNIWPLNKVQSAWIAGAVFVLGAAWATRDDLTALARSGPLPFAGQESLVAVDAKAQSALEFLQQSTINTAQDWYEHYSREAAQKQVEVLQHPNDARARQDLEFDIGRRDFYRSQLDDVTKQLRTSPPKPLGR